MAYLANNLEIFSAVVQLFRTGAWVADLRVDGADVSELVGSVALDLDGFLLKGFVKRVGTSADLQHVRVVGGAGGLASTLEPKHYRRIPASEVAGNILASVGETLATDSTGLEGLLPHWTRFGSRASEALSQLTDHLGLSWRVKPDGSVWVGRETWPIVTIEGERVAEVLDEGRRVYGVESPTATPGTTIDDWKIALVEHDCSAEGIRTTVFREDAE